ncbi:hypothetical protein D3C72_2519240 [compost metagenome]
MCAKDGLKATHRDQRAGSPDAYLSALSCQRAISVFDGSVSSSSLRAVSTPATGKPAGSSLPICTSTLAWSQ